MENRSMENPWKIEWKNHGKTMENSMGNPWKIHGKSMENKKGKKGNVSLVLHAPQKNIVFGLKNWDPI